MQKIIIQKGAACLSIMANIYGRNQFRNTGGTARFEKNCPTVTLILNDKHESKDNNKELSLMRQYVNF